MTPTVGTCVSNVIVVLVPLIFPAASRTHTYTVFTWFVLVKKLYVTGSSTHAPLSPFGTVPVSLTRYPPFGLTSLSPLRSNVTIVLFVYSGLPLLISFNVSVPTFGLVVSTLIVPILRVLMLPPKSFIHTCTVANPFVVLWMLYVTRGTLSQPASLSDGVATKLALSVT